MVRCASQEAYDAALEAIGKGVVFGVPATVAEIDPDLVPELVLFLELEDYALTGPLTHELQSLRGNDYPDFASTEIDDERRIDSLESAAVVCRAVALAADRTADPKVDPKTVAALAAENVELKAQLAKLRAR